MRNDRRARFVLLLVLLSCAGGMAGAQADPAAVKALLGKAGIPSRAELRGQMDTTGFAADAAAMDKVLAHSLESARPRMAQLPEIYGAEGSDPFALALCPHDDYAYAGRLYALALRQVTAKRVIVFGVFHKARLFGCRDRLVFDAFPAWRGPCGPIPVSGLRAELLRRLPEGERVVDSDMHAVEHSVEAVAYFLQAFRRDVEIVPVLVPYMDWITLDRLAGSFASALSALLEEHGWTLGQDVAVVCSVDGVNYGDAGWGGSNYCPFGSDLEGYRRAAEQERSVAGGLAGPLDREKARAFLERCVDPSDVTKYRLTWCGRFSVPFGLDVASRVVEKLGQPPLSGTVLDTGTSVSEAGLDTSDLPGLGVTAPSNFHHFVGYAAIGWK